MLSLVRKNQEWYECRLMKPRVHPSVINIYSINICCVLYSVTYILNKQKSILKTPDSLFKMELYNSIRKIRFTEMQILYVLGRSE